MAQGKIVQCIGAVVDVEFPREQMPRIYDALKAIRALYPIEADILGAAKAGGREQAQRMAG